MSVLLFYHNVLENGILNFKFFQLFLRFLNTYALFRPEKGTEKAFSGSKY